MNAILTNNWLDAQVDQVFIDPGGAVSLVPTERYGPDDRLSFTVAEMGVRTDQNGVYYC
jgi:hypothetical protein